jgi:hypothetical protein
MHLLTALDRETKLAVARAYCPRRQVGESNYPAIVAAIEVFRAARPDASDIEASRAVVLIAARAAQMALKWFWCRGGDAIAAAPPWPTPRRSLGRPRLVPGRAALEGSGRDTLAPSRKAVRERGACETSRQLDEMSARLKEQLEPRQFQGI